MSGKSDWAGKLLVAEDVLGDPNFVHTVVLLVSHDDKGAFGLTLNRPSALVLGDAAPAYVDSVVAGVPLGVGGPVEQEFLFTLYAPAPDDAPSPSRKLLLEGVAFEPDFVFFEKAVAPQLVEQGRPLKFLAGYAGWGPGQLEGEVEEGAWFFLEPSPALVFSTLDHEVWRDALRRKGGVHWALAETGYKPSLN